VYGIIVLLTYAVVMIAATLLFTKKETTAEGFLAGNHNLGTVVSALSVAATWIWAPSLFTSAEKAYTNGLPGLFWFLVPNVLCLFFFIPFAKKIRKEQPTGISLSDYMYSKYNSKGVKKVYTFELGALSMLSTAVQLLAGGKMLSLITGLPLFATTIILAVIAVAVYSVAPYLIVLYRYYQNFFTDEGYLTFTLPVKRYTLFNSKLLTALIFNVSTALVVFVSFLIAFGIAPELNDGSGTMLTPVFKVIGDIFELFFMFGNGWAVGYIILGVLIYIMSSVFSSLLVYACVTIGCIVAQKMKILVAVLVFYLANTVISIFSYIGTLLMELFTVKDAGLAPESGSKILKAQALTLTQEGSLLHMDLVDGNGIPSSISLHLRGGEEGPP